MKLMHFHITWDNLLGSLISLAKSQKFQTLENLTMKNIEHCAKLRTERTNESNKQEGTQ